MLIQVNTMIFFFFLGEKKERCQPVSHSWTPDSKLYCGCKGGQVISIDAETNHVTMVLNPRFQESGRDRTETLSLLRKGTMESIAEMDEVKGISRSLRMVLSLEQIFNIYVCIIL